MAEWLQFARSLGAARLGAMGAVAAILVGLFAVVILRLSDAQMAPLYADLTLEDSAAIVRRLEADNVGYRLRADGGTIHVPADQVARLRMRLAEDGLPTGGSVGYEIFDQSSTLGATSFVQNVNHVRALEGELARTIRAIERITAARVHLVIPERQLFQRDRREPSASIVVKVTGALETGQIRAIRHLAATAVDGLKPGRVSIVDETGRLLASGADGDGEGIVSAAFEERTAAHEKRLGDQIEAIVASVVGPGRVRVRVAAEIDHNRVTETRDSFDPDGQVVRSEQTRSEESATAARQRGVSVANELPGAGEQNGETGQRDVATVVEETVNYEISRTTRTEVVEAGRLKRLSVAVLVDGVYDRSGGDVVYAPRSAEELDRIAALVRSAIGFDAERGDVVEVVNLRFAEAPHTVALEPAESSLFEFDRRDLFNLIELAVAVILGVLVLLFVVRPLVRRIVSADGPITPPQEAIAGPANLPALPGTAGAEPAPPSIERARQSGAIHADTFKQVGTLIQENPSDAVAIVRAWLADAA